MIFTIYNQHLLPTSSIIRKVDYFAKEERAVVEFHTGRVYEYAGIKKELVKEWIKAKSQGSFFSVYIKNQFPTREITNEHK